MKPDAQLTAQELKQVRSLIGKLVWPARETMPHIAFDVSEAQQRMGVPTVKRMIEINAVLRKARRLEHGSSNIKIPKINLDKACMVAFFGRAVRKNAAPRLAGRLYDLGRRARLH